MANIIGTRRDHILNTLSQQPDRELRVSDLVDLAEGRFTRNNLQEALGQLLKEGKIVKTKEGSEAWWAIAAPPKAEVAPPSPRVRPINVIRNSRW
ncbi:MAG: hypothetical protein ACOYOB_15700 [Myxococcota bacterium]